MPIFNEKPVQVVTEPVNPIQVKIDPPTYEGITIDTKYVPSSAIMAWAEGSNWTVDYYSQVLGATQEPTPLALDREPVYQQYRQIKGMVLKVTDGLSFDSEQSTNIMTVTGSGWTFPFLTPNVGDMFIADRGDGLLGLFTITSARRATILRDSVYNVEWTMVGELSSERLANLKAKTVQTYYYSGSALLSGCGPFVTLEEKHRTEEYGAYYKEILKRYLTDFLSMEHSTFLVPDQLRKTYDHFVTRFFLDIVSTPEDPRIRRVRQLNVSAANVMDQPTVLDAFKHKDPARLYGSTERAHLVTTRLIRGSPLLQAIGFTGIDQMVYPIEGPTDVDSLYDRDDIHTPTGLRFMEGRPRRVTIPLLPQKLRNYPFFQIIPVDVKDVPDWQRPADIHPVVIDDYYIFSSNFYRQEPWGQSKLELLVRQSIEGDELNFKAFDHLLAHVYEWDNLERFYYHPIVLGLLRQVMR